MSAGLPAAGRVATGGEASFSGSKVCGNCHENEYRDWTGSEHKLSMQKATDETVLGDFGDTTFSIYGVTSHFFRRDGDFYVNTPGPAGKPADYRIDYTFGVYPLQQYLIGLPGGRYQALGIAWDARPRLQGGQHWFYLYPGEDIKPGDVLHWTGIYQNWNYMCADCHSTDVRRNYTFEQDRYNTTWSEIDVSCEACHGPGSKHVTWAESRPAADTRDELQNGLGFTFDERKEVHWSLQQGAETATRSRPPAGFRIEVETCARCHSRRAPLGDTIAYGKPLLDSYRVELLNEGLYYPDGQIKEEVYVYGSFLQSRMYRAGVTCSDCHNPHTLKLRAEGNRLCTRCHRPEKFDTPAHHFHAAGSPGSLCVNCHAQKKTYMIIDPRRDHSFRLPRPDLTVKLGVPNPCSGCHRDKTPQWAAARIAEWKEGGGKPDNHFGEILAEARHGEPMALRKLGRVVLDTDQTPIIRATGMNILGQYLNKDSYAVLQQGLRDQDPLVRLAALDAMEVLSFRDRFQLISPLLKDPARAVRLDVARLLAPLAPETLPQDSGKILMSAFNDYERAQWTMADRPEPLVSLANFYRDRGNIKQAEKIYQTAATRHPWFGPAFVNLADLYRSMGQEARGKKVLLTALRTNPEQADIHYAYGLLLVRQHNYSEAARQLQQAAEKQPDNAHYSYAYALALQRTGDSNRAISTLINAHDRHPNNLDILFALATMSRDRGDYIAAKRYAKTLVELSPSNPKFTQLLRSLQSHQ